MGVQCTFVHVKSAMTIVRQVWILMRLAHSVITIKREMERQFKPVYDILEADIVTGHRSNTLDNQCGAAIADSSMSGASLPLLTRQRKGKQLGTD